MRSHIWERRGGVAGLPELPVLHACGQVQTLLSQLVGGRMGPCGLLSLGSWGWASHMALLCGCSHVGTREAWRVSTSYIRCLMLSLGTSESLLPKYGKRRDEGGTEESFLGPELGSGVWASSLSASEVRPPQHVPRHLGVVQGPLERRPRLAWH